MHGRPPCRLSHLKRGRQRSATAGSARGRHLILNFWSINVEIHARLVHNQADDKIIDWIVKYVLKQAFVSTAKRSPPRNVISRKKIGRRNLGFYRAD
jgi:hypothetical protein